MKKKVPFSELVVTNSLVTTTMLHLVSRAVANALDTEGLSRTVGGERLDAAKIREISMASFTKQMYSNVETPK